jgi:hypothetical protein
MQVIDDVLPMNGESESLLSEVDDLAADDGEDGPDGRAAAILRYFVRCGWVRQETQADFSVSLILPEPAFRLAVLLHDLQQGSAGRTPLAGLICSIHDLLLAALEDGNAHLRLPTAWRQSQDLLVGLRELQHNIGIHLERVVQEARTADVLDHLFGDYRRQVVDPAYHQLRTTDHIARFRLRMLTALDRLAQDDVLLQAASRLRSTGMADSVESAMTELSQQVDDVRAIMEGLDRTLRTIDDRHRLFVESAVRRIEMHLHATSTVSGRLNALIESWLTAADPTADDLVAEAAALFEMALPDAQSLAPPTRAPQPFVPEPVSVTVLDERQRQEALAKTQQQLRKAIGRRRIQEFVESVLGERTAMRASEIPDLEPELLPLLIYTRRYGDGSLGYEVEELAERPWIMRDEVGFHDFVIRRVVV